MFARLDLDEKSQVSVRHYLTELLPRYCKNFPQILGSEVPFS